MTPTIDREARANEIHGAAVRKGFWDEPHSPNHYLMLVITELSEAVEAHREGRRADRAAYQRTGDFKTHIKDSVEDELADAYIRLLDLAQGFGYKLKRRYTEGEEQELLGALAQIEFTEQIFSVIEAMIKYIADATIDLYSGALLDHIEAIAQTNAIDLAWHIEQKMSYNQTRPTKHGKEY